MKIFRIVSIDNLFFKKGITFNHSGFLQYFIFFDTCLIPMPLYALKVPIHLNLITRFSLHFKVHVYQEFNVNAF